MPPLASKGKTANWNKLSQESNTCSPCSYKHMLQWLFLSGIFLFSWFLPWDFFVVVVGVYFETGRREVANLNSKNVVDGSKNYIYILGCV